MEEGYLYTKPMKNTNAMLLNGESIGWAPKKPRIPRWRKKALKKLGLYKKPVTKPIQREYYIKEPTYTAVVVSTITDVYERYFDAPIKGENAKFNNNVPRGTSNK